MAAARLIHPINVQMPRSVASAREFLGHRSEPTDKALSSVPFYGSDGRQFRRPAIQGIVAPYNQVVADDGRFLYFEVGCFIDAVRDGSRKRLLFDHNDADEIGSTDDGLEFCHSPAGLAFRMPLEGVSARRIRDTIQKSERLGVSVATKFRETAKRKIAGHTVTVVTEATIAEASICRTPRFDGSWVSIVDLDEEPADIWHAARSANFRSQGLTTVALRSLDRLRESVAKLV